MPNFSGTKFGRNGFIVTIASRSPPTGVELVDTTSVGRQCAHKDVGKPNLSGTKFGCNGLIVTIALCCLHGRRYAEFVGNEIWLSPTSFCDDRL